MNILYLLIGIFTQHTILFAKTIFNPSSPVCTTTGCTLAACNLIYAMDPTIDPCDDLFTYACGGYLAKTPNNKFVYNSMDDIIAKQMLDLLADTDNDTQPISMKMAKQMYANCIDQDKRNQDSLASLLTILEEFGGIDSLINASCYANTTDLLAKAFKLHAHFLLFEMGVYESFTNKSVRKIKLSIDKKSFLIPVSKYQKANFNLNNTKIRHSTKILSLMEKANVSVTLQQIFTVLDEVFNFDEQLAKHMVNSTDDDQLVTLSNLQLMVPSVSVFIASLDPQSGSKCFYVNEKNGIWNIQWKQYIQTISPVDIRVQDYLGQDPEIRLERKDYFKDLHQLLSSTNCKTIHNYILISIILQYRRVLYPHPEVTSKTCVEYIRRSKLKHASGAMFARKHIGNETIQEAARLVLFLDVAVAEMIQRANWMDSITKAKALEKARAMNETIGAPDMSYDDQLLDMYYKGLTFQYTDSYVKLIQTLSQWEASLLFNQIFQFNDYSALELLTVWREHSPDYAGAFSDIYFNTIAILGGILQPPFFHKDYPKSVNFGGLGFVIGHEITHGFDSQGRRFDKNGNLFNWWDKKTRAQFDRKSLCLKDQYSNVSVMHNLTLDGVKTLGENIADNGAIKQALLAYRRWMDSTGLEEQRLPGMSHLDGEQIYFISVAQFFCGSYSTDQLREQIRVGVHSPNSYRINIPMSNYPVFSEVFKCKLGAPMNPVKKCSVW